MKIEIHTDDRIDAARVNSSLSDLINSAPEWAHDALWESARGFTDAELIDGVTLAVEMEPDHA